MKTICCPETSFTYRIFLFLAVLITGLILTYSLFCFSVLVQAGFNIEHFNELIAGLNNNVDLIRLVQVFQSFFVFILPPFLLTHLYKENQSIFLKLHKPSMNHAGLGILSIILMAPLINVLVKWNEGLQLPASLHGLELWMREAETAADEMTQLFMKGTSWQDLIVNLIIVGLLAGVGEELFFRGFLQSLISKVFKPSAKLDEKPAWVMHLTIWIIAFFFSAIHLQFYGFVPRMLLGAWFGYLLWWTGSIWIPVLAHITNNALSTVALFAANKGFIKQDPDQLGLNDTWWLSLISIALLTSCVFYFRKEMQQRESKRI